MVENLKIEYVNIDSIKPYENNAKMHPKEQIEQIKKSIEQFGMDDPIGIWKDEIVEGHGRLIACKELGMTEVPIIRLDHLSDEERKAYTLAHNKLTMNSDFDIDILNAELEDIVNIDMSDFGFDLDIEEIEPIRVREKDDSIMYFDEKEIEEDIVKNWNPKQTIEEYISDIIDIPTAKHQFNRLCQGYRDGYNISLLFNPHRLLTETSTSKDIYYGILKDEKYRKSFARFLVEVQNKCTTQNNFYKYIGIGTAGYQYVNEFQPYLARDIYKDYCKDGYKILNPCAGWGGRLLGIASCLFKDIEYVETDPSKETYKGLVELKKFLRLGDNYKQYNLPFEDLEVEKDYFDFVFTSPPYFDTEHYSDEDTQSYKKNNSYELWKQNFLYVMIDKIIYCMKPDATCMLNVGNKKYPISNDITKYLKDKYNINTLEAEYELDANENTNAIRSSEEDFLIFKK